MLSSSHYTHNVVLIDRTVNSTFVNCCKFPSYGL